LRPRIAIPVHYEGWAHFREDRATAERVLAAAPQEVRWLPIGEPVEL
jgi:L-ascorbate metabolism protein UlaG (beta-lactamase superfamily)